MTGKKCNVKFLDADVKRPLASVSAIVDEGNSVVFGPRGVYVKNTSIGQRIPMSRKGVFVVHLDVQACPRTTKHARFDEPNTNEIKAVSVNQNVEETRDRCRTKTENSSREEENVMWIEEVDDVDEGGRDGVRRQEDHAQTRSLTTNRTGNT